MRARLFAKFGPEDGLEVEFADRATIGRSQDNTVVLKSREVSQRHARVFFDAESAAYWLEDLGSLNGSRLDGQPVSGRQRLGGLHVLSFGDIAELFFVELELEPGEPQTAAMETAGTRTRVDAEAPALPPGLEQPAAREQTRVDGDAPILPAALQAAGGDEPKGEKPGFSTRVDAAPAELPASLAKADRAAAEREHSAKAETARALTARFVLEISGSDGGSFELREGENLVGRSGRAQVGLSNRELSRRHATLRVAGDRVWLRDEGSRNHTFVAGEQITDEVEIQPGSELRFGRLEARLSAAGPAAARKESE